MRINHNALRTHGPDHQLRRRSCAGHFCAAGVNSITRAHFGHAHLHASAMQPPLPADHALHLCESPLAGDPIIGAIRFASASEGRHGRLHRQPDVNKCFLGRRD